MQSLKFRYTSGGWYPVRVQVTVSGLIATLINAKFVWILAFARMTVMVL